LHAVTMLTGRPQMESNNFILKAISGERCLGARHNARRLVALAALAAPSSLQKL
jgi:hypothetical protein